MEYIVNVLIVFTSLIVVFYAYFRKNELAKLSTFVIFASILLQQFIGILVDWSLFDFIANLISRFHVFVVYGEVILLVILLVRHFKRANQTLKVSLLLLIVLKVIAIFGLL